MADSTGSSNSKPSFFAVFFEFLKIGAFAFGGPIATLAMINDRLVTRQAWIDSTQFQKWVSAAKLFPGPLATLVAIRIGTHRLGPWGGFFAGVGQILPAFILILILSTLTVGLAPSLEWQSVWTGLSLGAIALSIQAGIRITQPLFRAGGSVFSKPTLFFWLVLSGIGTVFYPKQEIGLILGSGLLSWGYLRYPTGAFGGPRSPREGGSFLILIAVFVACFKASVLTFGSGIAIVPVLKSAFIEEHAWVSAQTFMVGLTLSQVTPGPLVILATYLGFQVAGYTGAVAATIGTFLPSFIFGTVVMPKFESKMAAYKNIQAFFQGVIPAVCGAIFGAMVVLTQVTITAAVQTGGQSVWLQLAILGISFLVAARTQLHPVLILVLSGGLGWASNYF
jgi:chromate transporter